MVLQPWGISTTFLLQPKTVTPMKSTLIEKGMYSVTVTWASKTRWLPLRSDRWHASPWGRSAWLPVMVHGASGISGCPAGPGPMAGNALVQVRLSFPFFCSSHTWHTSWISFQSQYTLSYAEHTKSDSTTPSPSNTNLFYSSFHFFFLLNHFALSISLSFIRLTNSLKIMGFYF